MRRRHCTTSIGLHGDCRLAGSLASDEARAQARLYGITLRPGETFVLPHKRGLGSEYLYYGGREMRSTHAVAMFERAFWD